MTTAISPRHFTATTCVSPMMYGGDAKDQDRAVWCEPLQSACLCDGVSASPHSAEAAERVAELVPVLLRDRIPQQIESVSHLLVGLRLRARETPVPRPTGPLSSCSMLADICREKMESSFQTTMVGAGLVVTDSTVMATVVRCGDSAFFAFSPQGDALATSLPEPLLASVDEDLVYQGTFAYGPGDEILARIVCSARDRRDLVREYGVRPEASGNWVVCAVVERLAGSSSYRARTVDTRPVVHLRPGDLVLVPRYLVNPSYDIRYRDFCILRYSSSLRCRGIRPATPERLSDKGVLTAVLPDSVFVSNWICFEDHFGLDAHFVLASDGFYSGFDNPSALWKWLQAHARDLSSQAGQCAAMEKLHSRLHARSGDDDMSFIWIYPRQVEVSTGGDSGGDDPREGEHVS